MPWTPRAAPPPPVGDEQAAVFYEPGRLERARSLAITKTGPGRQYRVKGQDEPWYDVDLDVDPPCYCADQENRGKQIGGKCKHVLAALLQERHPALLQALGESLLRQEQNLEELLRESIRIAKAKKADHA